MSFKKSKKVTDKKNLICFGCLPWSPMWKRNQTMISTFSKMGIFKKVLFINCYVRLTDFILKFKLETTNVVKVWSWKGVIPKEVSQGVSVLTTIFVGPNQVFGIVNIIISKLYLIYIKKNYANESFDLFINDYDPNRKFFYEELIKGADRVFVDLSDDFVSFNNSDKKKTEILQFIKYYTDCADKVICVNEMVREKYGEDDPKYIVCTNGINVKKVEQVKLLNFSGSIVGYMGTMTKTRINTNLLEKILMNHPDVSFVFLGQEINGFCDQFKKYENFYYMSPVPYQEMLGYIEQFDLAIIPHKINEHTKGNNLLKVPIFMSLKVPLITTRISDVDEFEEYVDIVDSDADFLSVLKKRLSNQSKDIRRLNAGYEKIKGYSWENKCIVLKDQLDI